MIVLAIGGVLLPSLILYTEGSLRVIERARAPVAFPGRELERSRQAPEPDFDPIVRIDPVYAADVAIAVEHVEVVIVPGAALAGNAGAANDQGGVGHDSQNFPSCANSRNRI